MSITNILETDGSNRSTITLPAVFQTPYRPEVIQKVYNNLNSYTFQRQGRYPAAGQMVSAESRNTGLGIARIARARGEGFPRAGQAAGVASVRHGRLAHPPVSWKNIYKKVNKKEKLLALCSAIAATTNSELIKRRGHKIKDEIQLPIVVSNEIESVVKSKDLEKILFNLGLEEDLKRTFIRRNKSYHKNSINRRSALSVLILVGNDEKIGRLSNSLPGITVKSVKSVSVLDLAPGSKPVRLTIFSENAIKELTNLKCTSNTIFEMGHQ
ncbi:MAG: 50S ribosomal protein L4 [Nitrososphaeraceae archaeon]|jgi:large subunit ribosomal protein L4e|nr:50S ribosomal protein L4 [Nitrososphaeraceae archaeon]HKX97488.1 50S ribosomal protein L4 [Candidatus Nitrosocosmicus sp.]